MKYKCTGLSSRLYSMKEEKEKTAHPPRCTTFYLKKLVLVLQHWPVFTDIKRSQELQQWIKLCYGLIGRGKGKLVLQVVVIVAVVLVELLLVIMIVIMIIMIIMNSREETAIIWVRARQIPPLNPAFSFLKLIQRWLFLCII